jgi:hypothetical protein
MKTILDVRLELTCASASFLRVRNVSTAGSRERLRQAVVEAVRAMGGDPLPSMITTRTEALDQVRGLLKRCEELGVPWTEIVAIVNRGYADDQQYAPRELEPV